MASPRAVNYWAFVAIGLLCPFASRSVGEERIVSKEGDEIRIEAARKWVGRADDKGTRTQCPKEPITDAKTFEKLWVIARGKERVPKVDFAKEFVLVSTSEAFTMVNLHLEISGMTVDILHGVQTEGGGGKGYSYIIAVFRREMVDVADGELVLAKKGK